MRFSFTQDQEMARKSVEELVARACPAESVRAFAHSGERFSAKLWHALADAGFTGVLVGEEQGGSGLGMIEAGIVIEALGARLASVPYLPTAVAAADLIGRLGSTEQKARWLQGISEGRVAAAIVGCSDPASLDKDGRLHGRWAPVANAIGADLLMVVARDPQGAHWAVVVDDFAGHSVAEPFVCMDSTRRYGIVDLQGVQGERLAAPLVQTEASRLRAVLAAGSAAEMMGGAVRVLDMETSYAIDRTQFGRPIGSFQAIKHMLADQLVALEGLRSLVWAALWSIDHASEEEALLAALTAKVTADEVVLGMAGENIQVHGGSGFTMDIDAHLYVKRAQMDRLIWGPPAHQTEFLEQRLEELG